MFGFDGLATEYAWQRHRIPACAGMTGGVPVLERADAAAGMTMNLDSAGVDARVTAAGCSVVTAERGTCPYDLRRAVHARLTMGCKLGFAPSR
jgi:hypothetical protein